MHGCLLRSLSLCANFTGSLCQTLGISQPDCIIANNGPLGLTTATRSAADELKAVPLAEYLAPLQSHFMGFNSPNQPVL